MKKIFGILTLVLCFVGWESFAHETSTQTKTEVQVQDCVTVGNVTLEISYNGTYSTLQVRAYNANNYRVSIAYKLMETDGIRHWPADSGVLSISKQNYNYGPSISWNKDNRYYLEYQQPQSCN